MSDAPHDSPGGVLRLLAWAKAHNFAVSPDTYELAVELGVPVQGVIVATPDQPWTGWRKGRSRGR